MEGAATKTAETAAGAGDYYGARGLRLLDGAYY